MSSMIRIGVAGAGVFGGHHASKYARMENAALAGVFDIDPVRANKIATLYNTQSFDDYAALVGAVDAVVIAAPATTHYPLVRQALEAGRHVFVEKPLALDPQEAEALPALAERQGLVLQVGHQERYVASALGLMEYAAAPVKIECMRCAAPSDRCRDVSVVFDLMIHDFDLVRQLTKSSPESIKAEGSADEARAELSLRNGVVASFHASRNASELERRMRFIYEEGFMEIDFMKRTIVNTMQASLQGGFSTAGGDLAFTDPLGLGAEKFIAAIRDGDTSHVSGREGADAAIWACAVENAIFSKGAGQNLFEATMSEERVRA